MSTDAAAFFEQRWWTIIDTQPVGIRAHLAAERQLVHELLQGPAGAAYRTVLEGGCADGTLLLPVIRRCGRRYVGLDIATGAVQATLTALDTEPPGAAPPGTPPGAAWRGDVRELAPLIASGTVTAPPPLLVALPFNVFGGMPQPWRALAAARDVGADLLILTYDTSDAATALRAQYYHEAGFRGWFSDARDGVHFVAGPFTSDVYDRAVLTRWIVELGYEVDIHAYGDVGLAYHARGRATGPAGNGAG